MIAIRPPMIRVVTRNGSDGIAITSRASTSSEIRIPPSWPGKPQPTVPARGRPAASGGAPPPPGGGGGGAGGGGGGCGGGGEGGREEGGGGGGAVFVQRGVPL